MKVRLKRWMVFKCNFGLCDMNLTIQNHARTVKAVFLVILGLFWGTQVVQIYGTRPFEIDELEFMWNVKL